MSIIEEKKIIKITLSKSALTHLGTVLVKMKPQRIRTKKREKNNVNLSAYIIVIIVRI